MPTPSLPILSYHGIDTSGSVVSTPPDWFARTMRTLLDSGFEPVDLASWIASAGQGPPRPFAVTFDDGLKSTLKAAELLADLAIPATMFLVTSRMGLDNAWPGQPSGIPRFETLSWSDARDLLPLGIRFGAHTQTHPDLRNLDTQTLLDELRSSRDAIESHLAEPCPLFAYPYGHSNQRIQSAAKSLFHAALGTRLNLTRPSDDPHKLPRLDAYYLRHPRSLSALISNRWHTHSRLSRWMRSAKHWPLTTVHERIAHVRGKRGLAPGPQGSLHGWGKASWAGCLSPFPGRDTSVSRCNSV